MDSENDRTISMPGLAKPQDKTPRKPRPSEIAAKKKAAKRKKKMVVKPKTKKLVKRPKVKTKRKPGKVKVKAPVVERCERLDLRLTKAEKIKVTARAKKLKRTLTSIISEAISRLP